MIVLLVSGNSQDLRLVRQYLELALPDERFEFLMSAVNEVSIMKLSSCYVKDGLSVTMIPVVLSQRLYRESSRLSMSLIIVRKHSYEIFMTTNSASSFLKGCPIIPALGFYSWMT